MKPIIGVTTFYETRPKKVYQCISSHYIEAIERAGGIPFPLPMSEEGIMDYLELIDGLVLSGGEDIAPSYYHEEPSLNLGEVCMARDAFEIKLFLEALARKIPILGICRGHQLINVALGGTLYQDICTQQGSTFNHSAMDLPVETCLHKVTFASESTLCKILKKEEMEVNTLHHQAVKDLGRDLRVTAVSSDGIIEGIEYAGGSVAIGVQWHPEDLVVKSHTHTELFAYLIEAAKGIYKIEE